MELTDNQFERYARHLILDEVGDEGQEKLLNSKVLCVGAGGLGSPVLMYLAAAWVSTISIIDDDDVDLSNLQRQVIHATSKVGTPKVSSAEETLLRINPTIRINPHRMRLLPENVNNIFSKYDLIVDGSDNFLTRYMINDAAYFNGKTVVSGALLRFEGQLTTFRGGTGGHNQEPCYRCLFNAPPSDDPDGFRCEDIGILGAVAGVIGTLQATEVLKELLNLGDSMSGQLLIFDALEMTFRKIRYKRNLACALCGEAPTIQNSTGAIIG